MSYETQLNEALRRYELRTDEASDNRCWPQVAA